MSKRSRAKASGRNNQKNAGTESKYFGSDLIDVAKEYQKILSDSKKIEEEILDITNKKGKWATIIKDLANSEKKDEGEIQKLLLGQSKNQQKQLELAKKRLLLTEDQLEAESKILKIKASQSKIIETQLGFLDNIESTLSRIPILGEAFAAALDSTNLKAGLTNKIMENIASGSSGVSGLFKGFGPILKGAASAMKAFLAPLLPFLLIAGALYALKKWVDKAIELDAVYTNISNTLGVTKEYAAGITKELVAGNIPRREVAEFAESMAKSFGEYSVSLMGSVPTLHGITFDLQVSSDAAAELLNNSELLGQSLSSLWTSTVNVTKEYYEQNGLLLKEDILVNEARNSLLAISKINKTNLALYGKSNDKLAASVLSMRRLGMEFDDIAKTAESVLNFESSIESEMKSNVLLGKSINLNMVRYEALFGNAEGVAREMNKVLQSQNINLNAFNQMAPFQKKALSETLGMQADELQMMLLRNKLADKTLLSLVDSNKISTQELSTRGKISEDEAKQLLYSQNRASVEARLAMLQEQVFDKLNNTLDKLSPLFDKWLKKAALDPESINKRKFREYTSSSEFKKDWLDAKYANTESGAMAHDFIWREGSGVQSFSKGDLVMGIDQGALSRFSSLNNSTSTTISSNSVKLLEENNRLMSELIKKVDQPVQVNVNGRVIDEIDTQIALRKSYNVTDQSYGSHVKR